MKKGPSLSHPKLPPMFGDEVLGAEVPVAAMRAPKIPPLQGEGATASIVVVTRAISSPKLPPMQGD